MVETVKQMFNHAKKTFANEEIMMPWLEKDANVITDEKLNLLMTP